ncbi:MAG TPA: hypothetical protein VJM84_00160 [Actinomycetota bacterium]|nr:hypothetical protein [Actinomycetota bacterium]
MARVKKKLIVGILVMVTLLSPVLIPVAAMVGALIGRRVRTEQIVPRLPGGFASA